jgi:hypothetical protein
LNESGVSLIEAVAGVALASAIAATTVEVQRTSLQIMRLAEARRSAVATANNLLTAAIDAPCSPPHRVALCPAHLECDVSARPLASGRTGGSTPDLIVVRVEVGPVDSGFPAVRLAGVRSATAGCD